MSFQKIRLSLPSYLTHDGKTQAKMKVTRNPEAFSVHRLHLFSSRCECNDGGLERLVGTCLNCMASISRRRIDCCVFGPKMWPRTYNSALWRGSTHHSVARLPQTGYEVIRACKSHVVSRSCDKGRNWNHSGPSCWNWTLCGRLKIYRRIFFF